MAQKVNLVSLRLNISESWISQWYTSSQLGEYSFLLFQDNMIREYLLKKFKRKQIILSLPNVLRKWKTIYLYIPYWIKQKKKKKKISTIHFFEKIYFFKN